MKSLVLNGLVCLSLLMAALACVDPEDLLLRGRLNVVVVDGTITNLAEPQLIRLNRSGADLLTGLPSSTPLTNARVEVVVDSGQVVVAPETEEGRYQLPSDFRGQIGHAYQLRFTLSDGTQYSSTQQVMPAVPSIQALRARFNPTSLPATQLRGYRAAHDLYLDTQDPAGQPNYYRWGWKLWEKQDWCRSCVNGQYSINNVLSLISGNGFQYFQTGDSLLEDCFYRPPFPGQPVLPPWVFDYPCRTQCWAIFESYTLAIFADTYSDGGMIAHRNVAQIPFYQNNPCLVEIRQASLTPSAYRFYKILDDQTQNNGGVADTPPSVSVGNVRNIINRSEVVVGVFTASGVATKPYWLDRKDTEGIPPGLFQALNDREPVLEPTPPRENPPITILTTIANKPPYTAICRSTDSQTPFKPVGWRE